MPITPKGYCDYILNLAVVCQGAVRAEMPITPKGYCDKLVFIDKLFNCFSRQKCP